MGFCARCGFELGIGRFCTNCGHPVAGGTVADAAPETLGAPVVSAASVAPEPARTPTVEPEPRRSRWVPYVLVGVVLGLLLAVVVWRLTGNDEPADRPSEDPAASAPSDGPGDALAPPEEVSELAAAATPRVPATAPPTQSLAGDPVDFRARNLVDGDRATAWRMPGDGTGAEIVLELGEEAVVTSVGLVNGYAKTDTDQAGDPVRWYRHNRRIEEVTWVFDDGTEVVQRLRSTQRMQSVDVDPTRTSSVRLRLDAVSAPGRTDRARDFTPISEVTITGAPAGGD